MESKNRISSYLTTFCFALVFLTVFKPFIVNQIVIRGDGYIGFGMYGDAIRQYKKALLLSPKAINARNWLAYAYKMSGNGKEALKTYESSLRITPSNIVAYYELGMARALEKDFKEAESYFLKAISISAEDSRIDKEEYDFYHNNCVRMLETCRKRLQENRKD